MTPMPWSSVSDERPEVSLQASGRAEAWPCVHASYLAQAAAFLFLLLQLFSQWSVVVDGEQTVKQRCEMLH